MGFLVFLQCYLHLSDFFLLQVNPLFDNGGVTSLLAANVLFELLCVLPGVKYIDNSFTRNTKTCSELIQEDM